MGGEQHLLFCSCGHSQMKGLKMESVFMIWMIWETGDDTGTTFCFHKFVISDLVGKSQHNNDPSDAVIVSHLRKYSFFSAVRIEIGWETQDLLFSSHHSICLRPAFWISGGKKGLNNFILSFCEYSWLWPATITILLCKSWNRGGKKWLIKNLSRNLHQKCKSCKFLNSRKAPGISASSSLWGKD